MKGYLTNSTGYSLRRLVAWVSTNDEISYALFFSTKYKTARYRGIWFTKAWFFSGNRLH